jgi:hypothetical protein
MITREDLMQQYENEVGIKNSSKYNYFQFVEKLYLDKLNEEKELNDKLTEFMLQDGE